MKYACKIDLPNNAKEVVFAGAKLATYVDIFDIHKAINRNKVFSCLPEILRDKKITIHMANVIFNETFGEVWAHTHIKEKCVLNIYFKTNGEETVFYEGDEVEMIPSTGKSSFYKKLSMDTLYRAESFIAKDDECWLLKTNQPHSVISNKKTGVRSFLQIYFYENEYDEIVSLLGEEYASH